MEIRKGYKQTEVGVIPEDWEVEKLSNLVPLQRGIRYGIVQPGKYEPDGCLMLRSQDYSKGWTNSDAMHRVNPLLENQYKNARLEKDDLIMTVVGAGIGQVVIAPFWLDKAIVSRSTARIGIDNSKAAKEYVLNYLISTSGLKQILDVQKEGAQPVLSCLDLAKFNIPYPPLSEQTAIATALSDADALIASLEKLIAKKRAIKQGAMQELLKPKEGWVVKKLGEICDINKGEQLNRATLSDNDTYPVLNGGIAPSGYTNVFNQIKNTIIISEGGNSCGFVNYIKTNFWQGGHCYSLKTKLSHEFLYQVLKFYEKNIMALRVGSGLPNIQRSRLISFEISIPKTEIEQTKIATILSDMDAELAGLEAKLEKYKQVKLGMMQELLTGRIRLV